MRSCFGEASATPVARQMDGSVSIRHPASQAPRMVRADAPSRGGATPLGLWLLRHRWALMASFGLVVILYARNFAKLVSDWSRDENYSHGFVVPIAFAWMVWQRRADLARLPVLPRPWGLALIAMAVVQLLVGTLGAEFFVAHTSLLVLLSGMILYLVGTGIFRQLAFPVGWLLFMIPLPAIAFNAITFPLQLLASRLASGLLDLANVPNLREGNILHLSNFTLGVVEACSGVRSLISLVALAALLGYFWFSGKPAQWILLASAAPVAVGVNALRVAGTGVVGNYWGQRWAEGFFHAFSGWALFLGAVVALLAIARALAWRARINPMGVVA